MTVVREARMRVRYHETDQGGVVYHSNYLYYFETGRTEFMRDAGVRYRDLEDEGNMLVVADARLHYRASARYDDGILVLTRVTEVTPVTVTFAYEVFRDPERVLLVEGETRLACVGRDFKPKRLPAHVAATLRSEI